MKKWNKISSIQYGIMIFYIINSTTLICMNYYTRIVDGYLIPLFEMIIGFIPLLIFLKLNSLDLTIYELIEKIFKKFSILFNIILCTIIYLLIIVFYKELLNYIQIGYLYNTNILAISIIFSISIIYTCTKSINVLFRSSNVLFYISTIIFLISVIGLLNEIRIDNVLPFLEHGISPLFTAFKTIIYIFPIFILLSMPKESSSKSINKHIITFYIIGYISKIIVTFITISVLGIDLANLYNYPEYLVLRRISTTGFFQRFESILGIQWIIYLFIVICLCFNYIKNYYKHLNKNKSDLFIIIMVIITIIITK